MLNIETIIEMAERLGIKWKNLSSGFILSLIVGAVLLFYLITSGEVPATAAFPASASASVAVLCFWAYTCRIPKNKPGKIGIALALQYETLDERKRIHADLVEQIASRLANGESAQEFQVCEIPGYLAPEPNDVLGAAKFFKRSNCHLLIWGSLRTRRQGKSSKYCLRLEGAVTHATIDLELSKSLAQDIRHAIPKQTEIDFANELRGFESTSVDVCDGAQFVVALAAAVSGDWAFSRKLLEELNRKSGSKALDAGNRGKKSRRAKGTLVTWRSLIAPRLVSVCFAQFHVQHMLWQQDKSNFDTLTIAEEALEAFKRVSGSESPVYWINKALLEVTLRKDFVSAENLLNRCRAVAITDPTWRLSLAFVLAAKGNPMGALKHYDTALKTLENNVLAKTIMDVEEYVHWWLETYNAPPTLYLLSAELNAQGKKDWGLALSDLDKFIASGELSKHPELGTRIADLRAELSKAIAEDGSNAHSQELPDIKPRAFQLNLVN
jgi:tetratricopeptide (TPR) repeat protein